MSPHAGGRGGVAPQVVGVPGPETVGGIGEDPGGGGGGIAGGIIPEETTAALMHRLADAACNFPPVHTGYFTYLHTYGHVR